MKKKTLFTFLLLVAVYHPGFALGTPTVYVDEAAFKVAIGSDYYLDDFNDLKDGTSVDSLNRSSGAYAYTLLDPSTPVRSSLYEFNGYLSHNGAGAPFQIKNKGQALYAFGGYVYGSNVDGAFVAGNVTITVGTYSYIFTPGSSTSFIGFVFPDSVPDFQLKSADYTYIALDHFYVSKAGVISGLKEVSDKASVVVNPNPVLSQLTISTGNDVLQSVVINDLSGKTVWKSAATSTLDLTGLSKGLYLVQIKTASGVTTRQIIKQ